MANHENTLLLGIDVGTSVIKSVVFDLKGRQIAKASASVPLEHPKPGWAEQDMSKVWQSTVQTIREVIASREDRIASVSVSGQGGGMWLVDGKGDPVRKGITWLDNRSADVQEQWTASGTLDRIVELTGYHCFPGVGPLTLFRWFKIHEPDVLTRGHKTLWAKDWVKFKLTGELATDESDPSNCHFLRGERRFDQELLELAGIREYWHLLPPVVPSWEVMGRVTPQASLETGLRQGTPIASGAWDVSSTGLGAGCNRAGLAQTILGTGGIHVAVTSEVPTDAHVPYSLCVHCVPGLWVVNSMAMTATANLDWFIREFGLAEKTEAGERGVDFFALLNEKVSAVPPGANGVLYLPFLQGERAPFVNPAARAVFFGISNATQRMDMVRAIFEGVAFSTRHNYECIEQSFPIREVVLAGGGANSPVWSQIVADSTGKPMTVPAGQEFGALGAAINAGVAVGVYADHQAAVDQVSSIARRHEPSPENHSQYSQRYAAYRQLIEGAWRTWETLYDLA